MSDKQDAKNNDPPQTQDPQETSPHTSRVDVPAGLPPPQDAPPRTKQENVFPVVGIGASAGGLETFEEFFTHMPPDSGMAFVLVQHLSSPHKSILVDLIKRYTPMKVYQVTDGMQVEPNCVYVIPPNTDMALLHGSLHLMEPDAPRGLRLPIDFFFRSLAQDQRERAICVVLSGTGSDGTLGLKAVKGEGGTAMVQDPESAKYDGMPRSAIASGLVDYVLLPREMPAQLTSYVGHAFGPVVRQATRATPETTDSLQKVFILLRAQTGHDFSYYKQNTIRRRIERRMAVNQIGTFAEYIRYLQQSRAEVETLFQELLIGVTRFFRDPEAFEVLADKVLPRLLAGRSPDQPLRVWVPGCSTGEEAYSMAMLIRERMDEQGTSVGTQIFATDIDSRAISKARAGVYPAGIVADVSPERLARFFVHNDNTYQIKTTIRDVVVFAEQHVIQDPPFSKIDLISCRNLLIYMEPALQRRVLPLFHYALNQDGYLLLGNSETIGEFEDLFATIDRKWRLYQRRDDAHAHRRLVDFAPPPLIQAVDAAPAAERRAAGAKTGIREWVESALLAQHTPACAVINHNGEVVYIHGHTGKYLEPAAGEATLDILRMARQGLKLELMTAIRKAIAQNSPVRRPGLEVQTNGERQTINMTVWPVREPPSMRGLMMVLFQDVIPELRAEAIETAERPVTDKAQRIADLERELRTKGEYLQTTVEELETANEELKSTNEELQSSNEELQSTNEELETSKEELQSVNEELMTVNAELQKKVDELSQASNDMNNLLAGTNVGTIFVDHQLRIQRFTPVATQMINLIQTDVGRPLDHIVSNLIDYDHLVQDTRAVLDTLIPKEAEVQNKGGLWYLMRILPYRTLEHVIEGAVITFVEITEQRRAQAQLYELTEALEEGREYAQSIVDTVHEPLIVLDGEARVISANHAFYEWFQVTPQDAIGQLLYDLDNGQWNIPDLRSLLEDILPARTQFRDYRVTHDFETRGRRTMLLNAREIVRKAGLERLILLAIQEIVES